MPVHFLFTVGIALAGESEKLRSQILGIHCYSRFLKAIVGKSDASGSCLQDWNYHNIMGQYLLFG